MKLIACLDGEMAGTVGLTGSRASFGYAPSWSQSQGNYPLSQSMPLQAQPFTGKRVLNYLWGLLPDNTLTLDKWARQFKVSAKNPVALLAHVGEDCAGAVQFVTEERLAEVNEAPRRSAPVKWLTDTELARRIRRLAQDGGEGRSTPEEGQFSLSGAQSKTAFYWDAQGKRWGIPQGRTPTTHILKPVSNDFDGFAENEHFCLQLIQRLDIPAAATEWQLIGGIPTLVAERYDRAHMSGRWHRIHQEDCCQALGVSPAAKYENEGGPGFPQIMTLLNGSDEPEIDRDRMMNAAALAYFLGATDAHAKNYSLLYARGAQRPSVRLAPFYDVSSAWPYPRRIPPKKMKLAMRVGRHFKIQEILPRHFDELARACNYPAERLRELMRDLADRLPDEASTIQREIRMKGMEHEVLSKIVDGIGSQCKHWVTMA
jgi:serine/threonine-protein kinase HipA